MIWAELRSLAPHRQVLAPKQLKHDMRFASVGFERRFPATLAPDTRHALNPLGEFAYKKMGRWSAGRKGLAVGLAVMVLYTAMAALVHAAHHRAGCQASQGRDHPCFLYSFAAGHAGAPASASILTILPPATLVVAVVPPPPVVACAGDHRLSPSRAPPWR